MAIKLIMTDIDGTILPYGQKRVSARCAAAFSAAADAGIHIGPASGRFYDMVARFFGDDARCCQTCIASNGAEIVLDGQMLRKDLIDSDALQHAVSVVAKIPHAGIIYYKDGGLFLPVGAREDLAVSFKHYADICQPVDSVAAGGAEKANAFIVGDMDETHAFVETLQREVPELDFDVPQAMYANIMGKGVNKGSALRWLMDYLGLAPDEAVVFGDGGNDIALFEAVEHSVAVGGAMDEAKAAARWHIGNVEDDAVPAAIEAIVAGEWPFSC